MKQINAPKLTTMTVLTRISYKLQSTWFRSLASWLFSLEIIRKLSVLWRHPTVALLVLLLFTSPVQRLVLFFSPLIGCTLLCLVAFVSYGSLMDKTKERETRMRTGDEIPARHALGSNRSWVEFMDHHLHMGKLKPDGDLTSSDEKVKKTEDLNQMELFLADGASKLNEYVNKATGKSFPNDLANDKEIQAPIEDEFSELDGIEEEYGAADVCAEFFPPNTLIREVSLESWHTAPVTESETMVISADDCKRMDRDRENLYPAYDNHSAEDSSTDLGEPGTQRVNPKNESVLISDIENVNVRKPEINTSGQITAGIGVLDLYQNVDDQQKNNLQPYSSQYEENINRTAIDIRGDEENTRLDALDHDQHSADRLDDNLRTCSSQKQENINMIQAETPAVDENVGIDVLDCDQNSACPLDHSLQLSISRKKANSLTIGNEIPIDEKNASFDELDHGQNLGDLLDRKVQSYSSQRGGDQENTLVPQRWRDWVRGIEQDGLSIWTSEDKFLKKVDEIKLSRNYNHEMIGAAVLDEESIRNGAFTDAEGNEGILLENLSVFIQDLITKLQFRSTSEFKIGEANGVNLFSNHKGMTFLRHDAYEATGLKLDGFSSLTETLDDSNTEQGETSSRWDRELDSEKDFLDSDNEEGKIWPRASDASDWGGFFTAKNLKTLNHEHYNPDRESNILSGKQRISANNDQNIGRWQSAEDGEDSDESFDPYVMLFAQAASDVEETPPYPQKLPGQLQGRNSSQKTASVKFDNRPTSSLPIRNTRASLQSRGLRKLCCIGRAVRAMRGKLL